MAYIYQITNNINGKIYIGKTNYSIEKRWKQHINDSQNRIKEHRPLYRAFKKYGISNFSIEILEECEISKLEEREIYWISKKDSYKNGYNATLGGDGKTLYSYDEIVNLYKEGKNYLDIHKKTGCSINTISNILQSAGFDTQLIARNKNKNNYGKKCNMVDLKTNEILNSFLSLSDAARYIIQNNLSKDSLKHISSRIGDVCNKKRKTAYGFKWNFI